MTIRIARRTRRNRPDITLKLVQDRGLEQIRLVATSGGVGASYPQINTLISVERDRVTGKYILRAFEVDGSFAGFVIDARTNKVVVRGAGQEPPRAAPTSRPLRASTWGLQPPQPGDVMEVADVQMFTQAAPLTPVPREQGIVGAPLPPDTVIYDYSIPESEISPGRPRRGSDQG